MTDLHAHIIFNIDDGAEDMNMTAEMLERAKRAGIKKIIATPHFTLGDDVDEFVKRRERRLGEISEYIEENHIDISLKLGAEVYMTDELFTEVKLDKLTMGDSKVILTEFKYHMKRFEKAVEYIDHLISLGFTPLVAHVERYSFVRENPMLIEAFLSRGALLQINAISLFEDSEEGEFARMLLDERVVFAIASDMHHVPSLRVKAMEKLGQSENEYVQKLVSENPEKIFDNKIQEMKK